jgi:hypothetical protein
VQKNCACFFVSWWWFSVLTLLWFFFIMKMEISLFLWKICCWLVGGDFEAFSLFLELDIVSEAVSESRFIWFMDQRERVRGVQGLSMFWRFFY